MASDPDPASEPRNVPSKAADHPSGNRAASQASVPDLARFKPNRRAASVAASVPPAVEPGVPPGGTGLSKPTTSDQSRVRRPGGRLPSSPAVGTPAATRRLIVNADDFGRSSAINQAVIRAHREGILTTASLMVNGAAFDEAVELAKQNPTLGVGLHLTLICGKATCRQLEIPDLVNARGEFSNSPVLAGTRYFFSPTLRLQLAREIGAQFAKFKATGLVLDHVNGHLNLHLHPTVFEILASRCFEWNIRHLRITDDPFALNARLASGRWGYRLSHAFIFRRLARRARRTLLGSGIKSTNHVFGLLQNAQVDESFILKLLPQLPPGDSELYSHPSLDEFPHEFTALVSPRVKALVATQGIQLLRYQDL